MDQIINIAFEKGKFIALKYVQDIDLAEEIAQLATIQLYLNYDKIDKLKIDTWIFKVIRNLCMDYYRKTSKNMEILVDPLELSQDIAFQESHVRAELDIESYDFISETDKKLLKKYYNLNVPIPKLAQDFKIKKTRLKQKIYSLENEIKLFHLINSDIVYFNPLPTTKLTKKIDNFINILIKALHNNDLTSMRRYCKGAIIHDSIEKIKIKSYETCRVKVIEDKNYQIVIGYLDLSDQIKVFNIKFTIAKAGNIQVLEMPIIPERVIILDKKCFEKKITAKELTNERGLYNNKLGSMEEIEKKGIGKVIQTKEDFEG
ncbi:sigma-70 family RNA polymerase sigma factor [bacterium]|nr:sigma-70 family RNA polymerase sigma factor [bacterium]